MQHFTDAIARNTRHKEDDKQPSFQTVSDMIKTYVNSIVNDYLKYITQWSRIDKN